MEQTTHPKEYLITYEALDAKGNVVKAGQLKAKLKYTEFEALAGSEVYLKRTYPNVVKIICKDIQVSTLIGYMPTGSKLSKGWGDQFKDIFNTTKPPQR